VDGTHHRYGKESWPGFTALAYADRLVGDLLETLDQAGIRQNTSIFIVSDHGFVNVEKRVYPGVLLQEYEFGDRLQIRGGATAMVHSLNPETKEEDLEKARMILESAEGIRTILQPHQYAEYGLPHPSDNEFIGDLILGADDGYTIGGGSDGEYVVETGSISGAHGYLNDLPAMETLFVASGRGIRSGMVLDEVDNRSVAPTAARLLGLTLDTADGRVL
jgi:predicted AlkP superfamily pyrophosphatase or phosphodiesterase